MALGTNAKIALIKSAPLFENCSKQELQSIARIADELDVREGKVLIREGERGREFFVIVDGRGRGAPEGTQDGDPRPRQLRRRDGAAVEDPAGRRR